MNEEIRETLKEDVKSLNEKENLTDNCFVAAMDVQKGKSKKITVDADLKDGCKIAIIVQKDTITTSNRPTVKEKLSSFGFAKTVVKNVTSKLEEGKINSNHISDIRKINLLDEISVLDEASQQETVEEIIKNRNEYNLINSEYIAWLSLKRGKINKFLVENWYRGILRNIERLLLQADVSHNVIHELDSGQNLHLIQRIKTLIRELENLLNLLQYKNS